MRLIDADLLKKAIYKWMPKDMETWADGPIPPIEDLVVSIMMTIEEQPTVNEWIPCSEKLPKERERVLASAKGDVILAVRYSTYWMSATMIPLGMDEIFAWMPLPKPYEVR